MATPAGSATADDTDAVLVDSRQPGPPARLAVRVDLVAAGGYEGSVVTPGTGALTDQPVSPAGKDEAWPAAHRTALLWPGQPCHPAPGKAWAETSARSAGLSAHGRPRMKGFIVIHDP